MAETILLNTSQLFSTGCPAICKCLGKNYSRRAFEAVRLPCCLLRAPPSGSSAVFLARCRLTGDSAASFGPDGTPTLTVPGPPKNSQNSLTPRVTPFSSP